MRRRWSTASKVSAALAIVLGFSSFALVRGYAARVEALAPDLGGPVPVVLATSSLPRGTVLSPSMLEVASFPSRFAPPGAIRDPNAAQGRTLLAGLAGGEPLTRTRLSPGRAGPMAALVPPGLRAFSIATALPLGAVRAGDRVDVLATFAGGQPHTETVVAGVEILGVMAPGSTSGLGALGQVGAESGTDSGGQTLVLLVGPDQAERLAYARAFADLSVSVESPEEEVTAPA
jgi:pilus assembly protein CpaB